MPENSPSVNTDMQELNALMDYNPAFVGYEGTSPIDDWFASVTGQLTSADKRRMNEERSRDALAFKREFLGNLYMDNTEMQRKVADYKAAGLNPYALAGQSVSAPSVSASSSSVSSGRGASLGVSELADLISLPSKLRNLKAETRLAESQADFKSFSRRSASSRTFCIRSK